VKGTFLHIQGQTIASCILFSYNKARKIKKSQDEYCSKAIAGQWEGLGEFPEDLQWEALVDVLRGRVKVIFYHYFYNRFV
jgi:hypothetical protein